MTLERVNLPGVGDGSVYGAPQAEQPPYVPDDYFAGAPPRIMGFEAETRPSKGCNVKGIRPHAYQSLGMPFFTGGAPPRTWLEWGSIHDEVGEHIEVRIPESLGPQEAVASSLVAMNAFRALLGRAYPVSLPIQKGERAPTTVYYHAGSYDHQTGVYCKRGFHTSLMAPAPRPDDQLKIPSLFGSYKATASWAGAGALGATGFLIMQKGSDAGYSATTADQKAPLVAIHTVKNPNNDTVTPGFVRVEGRTGDALRSVVADFVDKAASSLILRIIEHQQVFTSKAKRELGGAMLADRIGALQTVAGDLSLRATLKSLDGQSRTAMNIQEILLAGARTVAKEFELQEDEVRALDLWQHLIDVTDRCDPLSGEIGEASEVLHWAYRLRYLTHKYDIVADRLTGRNAKHNSSSLAMDLIYPVDPMARFAERTATGIITPEDVAARGFGPPQGTRAKPRAELLRQHSDPQYPLRISGMRWNDVYLKDGGTATLEPYDTHIPEELVRQPVPRQRIRTT